ncbi:MAG TPA: stage II sporulation protein M [Vicinamibacterales bacterium]|nr:stage II sporulation protein M [Vicinamibacterales bacterium]
MGVGAAAMTSVQFEQTYRDEWDELEAMLGLLPANPRDWRRRHHPGYDDDPRAAARFTELYRRACGQLALARARAYPAHVVDRLDALTADAHQRIYHRSDVGWTRLRVLLTSSIPTVVRAHWRYAAVAAAAFVVPLVVMALLVASNAELILSVVSAETAASFEDMYSPAASSIGRVRTAETDWTMFGFYIRNNIGVAFQCFAGGLFAGVGSLFFLAYNGAFAGALAGYLVSRQMSSTFFSFVVTHAAFELTAIVLSGTAGLRIGHALIAPGRLRRTESLRRATREAVIILYGATAMLVVAAAVEAFWSSARWIPNGVKYGVGAACWTAVLVYLTTQGRRAA